MGRAAAHDFSPDVLVDLRRSAGLSQAALAEAVGVSAGSVRGWEGGRKIPQTDVLGRLAAVFSVALASNVTVADFVDIPEVGRTLADWRVLRALTQVQAAQLSGLSASHYGSLERGESALSTHTAERVAQALGIKASEALDAGNETRRTRHG